MRQAFENLPEEVLSSMNQHEILITKLAQAFSQIDGLFDSLSDEALKADLSGLRSNTIGKQLWCLAGARESFLKAVYQNRGFS
jgi:hypothetical protein